MILSSEEYDSKGNSTLGSHTITLPIFLKHLALAGQANYLSSGDALSRAVGAFLLFERFFDIQGPNFSGFALPHGTLHDPSETAVFSNLVGKAIGDYMAKRTLGVTHTLTYEAALWQEVRSGKLTHMPKGPRPDFYCFNKQHQFAIEAKGFSAASITGAAIMNHKWQAMSGPLKVHFAVASVTYDIYSAPECLFYDPVVSNAPYDQERNGALLLAYYQNIIQQAEYFPKLRSYELNEHEYDRYLLTAGVHRSILGSEIALLIDTRVGLPTAQVFDYERYEGETAYVDNDGIGIQLLDSTAYDFRRRWPRWQ